MMRKPPKYCQGFVDRHGKVRWYLRRPGYKRVPLPGLPWTPQFMAAYEAAMGGESIVPASAGSKRTKPGTIDALVASYYQSTEYRNLKPITQRTYRSVMEPFREQHGHRLGARPSARTRQGHCGKAGRSSFSFEQLAEGNQDSHAPRRRSRNAAGRSDNGPSQDAHRIDGIPELDGRGNFAVL